MMSRKPDPIAPVATQLVAVLDLAAQSANGLLGRVLGHSGGRSTRHQTDRMPDRISAKTHLTLE